jgi:Copper type II ascorbate-dependent monooxygenase, C-terminal domain
LLAAAGSAPVPTQATQKPTFYKDILPILQDHCQACHRPGEIAPMPFVTYRDSQRWAAPMKQSVAARAMPPWFADPRYGGFSNDTRLSDADIGKLVAWVGAGAPEGDPKDRPAPPAWTEGWSIRPDLVFEMPAPFVIPKTGVLDYTYFVFPTGFTKDTWVTDGEVRPGNRAVVHHVSVFVRPPGSSWLKDARPGQAYVPGRTAADEFRPPTGGADSGVEWLTGYLPGMVSQGYFAPEMGAAKLIPAGSDLVFEVHYTANGRTAAKDRTKLGLVLATHLPAYRLLTLCTDNYGLRIPPGEPAYESHASLTFNQAQPMSIVYLQPHMHMRGKDMEIRLEYPGGESEILLKVSRYSYLWQLVYHEKQPLPIPKGARLQVTAHFDNSANNPFNPDPSATVRWGIQSWDEMLNPFIGLLVGCNAADGANVC